MGKPPEIFVTVGNPTQPFDRLVRWIDEGAARLRPSREILVQVGSSRIRPLNCRWVEFIPMDEFERIMKVTKVIISHGGQGSILTALQGGHKPIVVPRRVKFGEHLNDHQLEITEEFSKRNLIQAAFTAEDLWARIESGLRTRRPFRYQPRNKLMLATLDRILSRAAGR